MSCGGGREQRNEERDEKEKGNPWDMHVLISILFSIISQ